jgi:hypothetical protein
VGEAYNLIAEVTAAGGFSVLNVGAPNGLGIGVPQGLAVDGAGNIFIADTDSSRVVEVTAAGMVSVLNVGTPDGVGLSRPYGVAVDGAGDIYIADTGHNRVVEVTATGTSSVVDVGTPDGLRLSQPSGIAVDGAGNIYIADAFNHRVVKLNRKQALPLSFGSSGTGVSSSQQVVTLQNIGNQPLNILALNTITTGRPSSSFTLNGSSTSCTDTTSLAAGATCSLGVEFDPLAAGPLTGMVTVTDNSLYAVPPFNAQQASLRGTGVGFAAFLALGETPGTSVVFGTPVAVKATVTRENGTPAGIIRYTLDGVLQPDVPLSSLGMAAFTLAGTLSVGTHSVTVTYSGDTDYVYATPSQTFSLTVSALPTTTTLAASSTAIRMGQSVTLAATVNSGSTPVTSGRVKFARGTTSIGSARLNAQGVAALNTKDLPAGIDNVRARFVGSANDAASTSAAVTVTVRHLRRK